LSAFQRTNHRAEVQPCGERVLHLALVRSYRAGLLVSSLHRTVNIVVPTMYIYPEARRIDVPKVTPAMGTKDRYLCETREALCYRIVHEGQAL
jgi:hypothetical protein